MALPDFSKRFTLFTDAYKSGLSAVLTQMMNGKENVIAYASQITTKRESLREIAELESRAVVFSVEKFRSYLQDVEFDVVTDHAALKKFDEIKDNNPRLHRWSIRLSRYNYMVHARLQDL